MKIYLMRHGRTNWNEKQITQGRSQNMLSKTGKAEVMAVAEQFAQTKIDLIVCSPLKRTVQTANLINAYHHVKIIKDVRLIELDQGVLTGKKYSQMPQHEHDAKRQRLPEYGLESWLSVYQRVKDLADNLIQDYPNQDILIVTHETPAIFLSTILSGQKIDKENLYPFDICRHKNAEIKEFVI